MSSPLIVQVTFWSAFFLDILIVIYALKLSKQMGGTGQLQKTTIYAGTSAMLFGIHHISELFLSSVPTGIAIAEGIEAAAAVFLLLAVYSLYRLTEFD